MPTKAFKGERVSEAILQGSHVRQALGNRRGSCDVALLTIIDGVNVGRSYTCDGHEMLIGRESTCQIVLPIRTISRQHARLGSDRQGFYLEDLGSVNGTILNGKKIDRRSRLENKDRIRIGQTTLVFIDAQPDAEETGVDLQALKQKSKQELAAQEEESSSHLIQKVDAGSAVVEKAKINAEHKLAAMVEILQSLGHTLDTKVLLPRILDGLFRIFPQADHGYILQDVPGEDEMDPVAIKHRDESSDTMTPLGGSIAMRVMTEGAAFLSSPTPDPEDEDSVRGEEPLRSLMCAPLMGPEKKPLGIVHLDSDSREYKFNQHDLEVLISVATLAGQAVEYAQMHVSQLELARQQRELKMAQDVQLHFLPQVRPEIPGYKFHDFYRPAKTVAGDYYDYIKLPDGRMVVAAGDVSGKGVSAALMMARLCSDARYSLLTTRTPAEAVVQLNQQMVRQLGDDSFITFVIFVIEPDEHLVTVVNAGHTPPLLRRADTGEITEMAEDDIGMPLGVDGDAEFKQIGFQLAPGDLFLCYTDGVNEAFNLEGKQYGNQQVRDIFSQAALDAVHAGHAVVTDVRRFAQGHPQDDDMCVVCFGRVPVV